MSGGAAVLEPGDVDGVEGDHCRCRDPVALHVAYYALDGGGRAALELGETGMHPAVVRTLVEMAVILRCASCLYRYSNSSIIEIAQKCLW